MKSLLQDELVHMMKDAIQNGRQFTDDEQQYFDQIFDAALEEVNGA